MDPVWLFPTEVVHQIWVHLKPNDLLACRAVASHWLESVTSCDEAWFTEFSYDWHEFLEVKKTLRRWRSGEIRRKEYLKVKNWVFTEAAFYLRMADDSLNMYDPGGNLVRVFHSKTASLHQGLGGLLIGVRSPMRDSSLNSGQSETIDTFATDGVMNVVDTLPGVSVLQAFPNGIIGRRSEDFFISIGHRRFPIDATAAQRSSIQILENCAISVCGLVDKTLAYFDGNDPDFVVFKTFKASPMAIPYVRITAGPKNMFSVSANLGAYVKIYVFDKKKLLLEATFSETSVYYDRTYVSSEFHSFTSDFFVVSHINIRLRPGFITVYPLNNFQACWTVELEKSPLVSVISNHPCSYLKNSFAALHPITNADGHAQKLLLFQIDDSHQIITEKGTCSMIPNSISKSVLSAYCSYFYYVEQTNADKNVHLYYFNL